MQSTQNGHERIPIPAIIAECDRLANAEKKAELGDFLRHWRAQAHEIGDASGELTMLSELMGHYRMAGDRERGLPAIRDGFALLDQLGIAGSASAGTILLNGATALQSFGKITEALVRYAEAFRCYQAHLAPDDWRFAGLFNNMASAYVENGDFDQAETCYLKALAILKTGSHLPDAAVTYVCLAQMYARLDPHDQRIQSSLDRAMAALNDPAARRDGYYAHTCRKSASAFGIFGRKQDEEELNRRADAIYAGH